MKIDSHVACLHLMFKKDDDVPYDLIQIQGFPVAVPLADKFAQMPNDVAGTVCLLSGKLQYLVKLWWWRRH